MKNIHFAACKHSERKAGKKIKRKKKNKNKLRISYKLKQKISLLCEKQLSLLLYSVTCNYSNSTGYRRNFHWRKYICSAFLKKNLKGGFRRSDRKMFFLVLLPFTTPLLLYLSSLIKSKSTET